MFYLELFFWFKVDRDLLGNKTPLGCYQTAQLLQFGNLIMIFESLTTSDVIIFCCDYYFFWDKFHVYFIILQYYRSLLYENETKVFSETSSKFLEFYEYKIYLKIQSAFDKNLPWLFLYQPWFLFSECTFKFICYLLTI